MKILLAFLLLSITAPVYSQDNLDHLFVMSLEDLLKVKVRGSTLTDESIRDVPGAVSVFTHDQIQRMGFDYLHELLNLVPGYQSQRTGNFTQNYAYSSRGRRNETQAKEILVIMDGRTLNDSRTSSANMTLPLILLEQIERVEIIRGPGSAIYGSSAFTGVINIVTRRGKTESVLAAGSHGQVKAHQLFFHEQGNWLLDVFAQAYRDSGEHYNVPDTFSNNRINTRDPLQGGQFDLALAHGDTLLRASVRESETDDFFVTNIISSGFNRVLSRQSQVSLAQGFNGVDIRSHLFLSYQMTRHEFDIQLTAPGALSDNSTPASDDPLLFKVDFDGESLQLISQNDWLLNGDTSIQFGAEWRTDTETKAEADNNFDVGQLAAGTSPINYYGNFDNSTRFGTQVTRWVIGAYVQYQQELMLNTNLLLGLRHDEYEQAGSRLSPRMGLVQSLGDVHSVKLLYGEAFRAPALNETGLINNPILVGNPDLKHEIVKTWELIWQGYWQHTGLSLGWFQNRFKDPIIQAQAGASTRTWVNGGSENSQGFEFEARHALGEHWTALASLTRLIELPDSALREAETLASLQINYGKNSWNYNVSAIYHGERDMLTPNDGQLGLDEYWFVNGKLNYSVNQSGQVYVQIKNLLDENYQTAAQGQLNSEGVPNRSLEIQVGMNWQF